MKKNLVVSHFEVTKDFSNGVVNYSKAKILALAGEYELCSKKRGMSQEAFQVEVLRKVNEYSSPSEVTIEAAESQASTLLLSRKHNTHIRIHCPFHLYKRIINEVPDEQRFSTEIRALSKAKAISSPSYGMLEFLEDDLDTDRIHVFKNPIDPSIEYAPIEEKEIDVIFLLRFNKLKGAEYINPILRLLPQSYNVYLIGKQEEAFYLDSRIQCNVTVLPHVEGGEKVSLLRRSKVSLSLSKFENCSMVILESIGAGSPVVCWDVGGNREIARSPVVNTVAFEDVFAFANRVVQLVEGRGYPSKEQFLASKSAINEDFINGVRHVERVLAGEETTIYRGTNFSSSDKGESSLPYELRGERWASLNDNPFKVTLLSRTYEHLSVMAKFFKSNERRLDVLYLGDEETAELEDNLIRIVKMNWLLDRTRLKKYVNSSSAELLVIEDPGFVSKSQRDEFVHSLKRPVLYTEYLAGSSAVFFDRVGRLSNSRFKETNIESSGSETYSVSFDKPQVLLVVEENNPSDFELDAIEQLLSRRGVSFCFINREMGLSSCSSFYITGDTSGAYSDVIVLDDAQVPEFIGLVNVFVRHDSAFLGKPGVKPLAGFDELGCRLSVCDEDVCNVKKFFEQKTLTSNSAFDDFRDECLAVLNQRSYKKNGI